METTRTGLELLEFIAGDVPLKPKDDIPLTFTQVIVQHENGYLLLYNPERQQWELPGGAIEPNEAVHECAIREVYEETSQHIENPVYRGMFKVQLFPSERLEYGALYTATLKNINPHIPNAESEKILFWNRGELLDNKMSMLGLKMFDFAHVKE